MRQIIRAVLVAAMAVGLIAAIATAEIGAEMARREASAITPTFIPAPRIVLLRCVEEMDGFNCVEVEDACR